MNVSALQLIGQHLKSTSVIEVREWPQVLWVKAIVAGKTVCRFVSKRIIAMKTKALSIFEMLKLGNRWTKGDRDRIYFDPETLAKILNLSSSKTRQLNGKFYYDLVTEKFVEQASSVVHGATNFEWSKKIREICTVETTEKSTPKSSGNQKPFPNAMKTSDGRWVTPDEWDEIEGAM